jgi:hypothetical protein
MVELQLGTPQLPVGAGGGGWRAAPAAEARASSVTSAPPYASSCAPIAAALSQFLIKLPQNANQ